MYSNAKQRDRYEIRKEKLLKLFGIRDAGGLSQAGGMQYMRVIYFFWTTDIYLNHDFLNYGISGLL